MACDMASSRFERRIEIVEARLDITDEEATNSLEPQLRAIMGEDCVRCWVEGTGTIGLVGSG